MIGTNAPRKTRTPIGSASGTPSSSAPKAMPTASVRATSMVARTKAVSETHATRADESTSARYERGISRSTHPHIRPPSAAKK